MNGEGGEGREGVSHEAFRGRSHEYRIPLYSPGIHCMPEV